MAKSPARPKLTPKQELFCLEYLKDLNATQAAIRAGYSARTAKSQGQRLLTNVDVAEFIAARQDKRAEKIGIDAEYLLRELHEMQKADVLDIIDDETHTLKPLRDWPPIWRRMLNGLEVAEIFETLDQEKTHVGDLKKIKMINREKILEMLGRHVNIQAFKDKIEHQFPRVILKDFTGE